MTTVRFCVTSLIGFALLVAGQTGCRQSQHVAVRDANAAAHHHPGQSAARVVNDDAARGSATSAPASAAEFPQPDEDMAAMILAAVAEYRTWQRVDHAAAWSPLKCDAPPPDRVRFSASEDDGTHGAKLYFLFAKNIKAYLGLTQEGKTPVGQVMVKETWKPVEGKHSDSAAGPARNAAEKPATSLSANRRQYYPYAERQGVTYTTGEKGPLFVMIKTEHQRGTDQGWIYATLVADGSEVTAAGRIPSCMECHAQAKYDRLFGWTDKETE